MGDTAENKSENIPALMELIVLFLFLYFHSIILNTLKEDFHTKRSNLDNKNQYGRKHETCSHKTWNKFPILSFIRPLAKSLHLTQFHDLYETVYEVAHLAVSGT